MSFFCAQEDVVYLAENSCKKKSSGMGAKRCYVWKAANYCIRQSFIYGHSAIFQSDG
ncbi:MAG: hypothetical protein V7K54_18845 [Nostoc sp.]